MVKFKWPLEQIFGSSCVRKKSWVSERDGFELYTTVFIKCNCNAFLIHEITFLYKLKSCALICGICKYKMQNCFTVLEFWAVISLIFPSKTSLTHSFKDSNFVLQIPMECRKQLLSLILQ